MLENRKSPPDDVLIVNAPLEVLCWEITGMSSEMSSPPLVSDGMFNEGCKDPPPPEDESVCPGSSNVRDGRPEPAGAADVSIVIIIKKKQRKTTA